MTAIVSTCNQNPPLLVDASPPCRLSDHNSLSIDRLVPFPLPKKLGSDRLLLVSRALHEIPTYKSISPELQKQRQSLKHRSNHSKANKKQQSQQQPRQQQRPRQRRVHFSSAVDRVHEYPRDYDEDDRQKLWFTNDEFAQIFERDDADFTVCFSSMAHTKQLLQLWGMCSRGVETTTAAVLTLFENAPHFRARGLEHRIIVGIRNHRQKAVQSFLQNYRKAAEGDSNNNNVCTRYIKFSQTAGRFAQALAEGDAVIARQILFSQEDDDDESFDDDCF